MRSLSIALATVLVLAHTGFIACHDHDDEDDFVEDVTVEITGDAGTDFDALFFDDHHTQTASGSIPLTLDFEDQVGFFRAVVDKDSSGSEEICVRVITSHDSRESCTTDPLGRVSVSVVF